MVPIIPRQRQHKPNAAKRFDDLLKYLEGEQEQAKQALLPGLEQEQASPLAAQLGRTAEPNEFSELLSYATAPVDTRIQGEKCVAIRTHGVSSIETASAEMNAVARNNARCLDPVYHFILSWPEHEKPARELIFDAADHAIKALGFEQHQYVVAIHANTDNMHAHVAVNRVSPVTYKSRHIEWAKRTLHFAARESEIKHGWTHDNGIYVVQIDGLGTKQIVLNTKHAETAKDKGPHVHPEIERDEALPAWHDPESLGAWLKIRVAPALKEDLPDLTSWQALHVWLERFDISLKDSGGGGLRLRAVSADTGEILDTPVSKALRLLKRPALEERWGPFKAPFTVAVDVPDFSHLTPKQIHKGVARVIRNAPDRGIPPPDHVASPDGDTLGPVSEAGSGLHAMPDSHLAAGGQLPPVLLQGALQSDLGDGEAGQDPRMRRADSRGPVGGGRLVPEQQGTPEGRNNHFTAAGRNGRDPEMRERRKQERAAARADLRKRFAQYRNFVTDGDTEHFSKLKSLRADRSREIQAIRHEVKAAKAAISKSVDRETRLVSLAAIDAEAARRRLVLDAKYQDRGDALRATRMPPLAWREWLYEQANRADKAALSALRGIVYQAQRDAKLPQEADEDELDDLDIAAADYQEQQYKRLMARLLAEERKEAAIRSTSVHAMRAHEVDALILAYAGMQWRVTGNGNIEYSRQDGRHLFTDRGNRVTFDRIRVTDEEIQVALAHSRAKFGRQLTLTGDDPVFVGRMLRAADDMGLAILNPELQTAVQAHRAAKKLAHGQAAKEDAQKALNARIKGLSQQAIGESVSAAQRAVPTVGQGGEGDASAAVPDGPLAQPQAVGLALPLDGEARLRALVLAIDPRARFELAAPDNEARFYVGPVAAVLDDDDPMFAQHLGRGTYVIHRQALSKLLHAQVVEVRYKAGSIATHARKPALGRDT